MSTPEKIASAIEKIAKFTNGFWLLLLPIALILIVVVGMPATLAYIFLHPHYETIWALDGDEYLSETGCHDAARSRSAHGQVKFKCTVRNEWLFGWDPEEPDRSPLRHHKAE